MHIVVVTTILGAGRSIHSRPCSILKYEDNLGRREKSSPTLRCLTEDWVRSNEYHVTKWNEVNPGSHDLEISCRRCIAFGSLIGPISWYIAEGYGFIVPCFSGSSIDKKQSALAKVSKAHSAGRSTRSVAHERDLTTISFLCWTLPSKDFV